MMKRFIWLIILIFLAGCHDAPPEVRDFQGIPLKLEQKWLIINYWASWCPSCLTEIAEFNQLYRDYRDKNVLVLGINYDHLPEKQLAKEVQRLNIKYPILNQDIGQYYGIEHVSRLPLTIIVSPTGKVLKKLAGQASRQEIIKYMKKS